MKLLIDAHVLDDLSQGSKTYLKGLYTSVLKTDHTDQFYFASNNSASVLREIGGQTNVRNLQYASHNRFVRLGWEIPQMVRKNRIDWAHYQYISPVVKSCSELVTIHDLLFLDYQEYFPLNYRMIKNFLFKRSAQRAEWVLTVSEYSRLALVKHYGIDPDRIVVTPNGILDLFWEQNDTQNDACERYRLKDYILYVSRIEPRKNQLGLLKSYVDLQLWKKGIQLVYVGGVGIRTLEFERQYQALDPQIRGMIVFLNDLPAADLKSIYHQSLLFVYPSFAEGFGIPPLEALACGANVICSNTTAMAEFDFLGERLFNPFDGEELKQKIEYFLRNPESKQPGISLDDLKSRYSWDSAAKKFLAIFK